MNSLSKQERKALDDMFLSLYKEQQSPMKRFFTLFTKKFKTIFLSNPFPPFSISPLYLRVNSIKALNTAI